MRNLETATGYGVGSVTDSRGEDWEVADTHVATVDDSDPIASFLEDVKEAALSEDWITFQVYQHALNFWDSLNFVLTEQYGPLPEMPVVAMKASGAIHFSWELGDRYVEAEFTESHSEVFHENDETGKCSMEEFYIDISDKSARWVAPKLIQ